MKEIKFIPLDEMDKKLPFSVPENYFNNFSAEMGSIIAMKNKASVRKLRPWMYAVAASVIGIVTLTQVYFSSVKQTANKVENYESYVLSQVDEDTMIDYYIETASN